MSDKLQKTDSAIVPASKIADKIASALKSEDKPANTGARWPTQNDKCKCGHEYSQHNYSDGLGSRKDPLGFMYECMGAGFSEARKRPNGEIYQGAVCACEQFEFASPAERQQAKVERFGMNAMVQGLAADKITKDLREWAMQSERVAERKNFVGTDFEALELRTLAASLVPTVTLPTESSAKSFDVKVVGEDGLPVKLSPEVEMPDLRVGCGAESPTIVNGKTLRCKKWRGHEGDHSDKIDGVPINWANK